LPYCVRGQRDKAFTVKSLKIEQDHLPGRKVESHFQGPGSDQNTDLALPEGLLCGAAHPMLQTGVMELGCNPSFRQ
jgi:hypothetical protein